MAYALEHPFDDLFTDRDSRTLVKRPPFDPRLLIVIVGTALLSAAIARGAPPIVEAYESAKVQAPPVAESLQLAELPREWRWERKAVTFDDMYRQKR